MTIFRRQQSAVAAVSTERQTQTHFKFRSRIAPEICAARFAKREKSRATICTSRCSRMIVCYRFKGRPSLTPCQDKVFTARQLLAENCAESRETDARWPRSVRQEIRRNFSRHIRATSRQWLGSGNGDAAECPAGQLARQLASRRTWPRNGRAGNLRDNSQLGRATANATPRKQLVGFSPSVLTMTFNNYEYINHTNARS